jgi:PAS domain S-box-containing protein
VPDPPLTAERERLLEFARASGDWMWETDAELRYLWISGAFEPITGQPDAMEAANRARAQSALLEQLSTQAPGVIYQFLRRSDGSGEFQFVNERIVDLFGITHTELLADPMKINEAVHPDDRRRLHGTIAAHERAMSSVQIEYRVVRRDGSERWMTSTSSPEKLPDGCIVWRGFIADTTERKSIELALRASEERWAMAADAAGIGIGEADLRSGELRTPLNGILGFAQLMALDRAHPLGAEQRRRLDGVCRAGHHLLDLINDVLDIARIEQGDFGLTLKAVDASRALQACLALIQPLAQARGITLPAPPAQPCWVHADARALEQVLMNPLSNAIKYNRAGGAVEVELLHDGEHVTLAVSDEGEGLSDAQQAQLFQPFNRLGAERQRHARGVVAARGRRRRARRGHGALAAPGSIAGGHEPARHGWAGGAAPAARRREHCVTALRGAVGRCDARADRGGACRRLRRLLDQADRHRAADRAAHRTAGQIKRPVHCTGPWVDGRTRRSISSGGC